MTKQSNPKSEAERLFTQAEVYALVAQAVAIEKLNSEAALKAQAAEFRKVRRRIAVNAANAR